MKVSEISRTVEEEIGRMPAYDEEVRAAANFLERRAQGVGDLPCFSIMLAPEFALLIAGWLYAHADNVEQSRG